MRIVLVGHGGREAALAWRIAQSPSLTELVVVGPNPGWPADVVVAHAPTQDALVALARTADLVVVGPEAPLGEGLANALESVGVPCFGPIAAAARLETSKAYAKQVMLDCGVPTAGALVVGREDREIALARAQQGAVAVKVDGLAAGKGVFVCETAEEALAAVEEAWSGRFGEAADRLVLEDLLTGPEVSVFGISDGTRVVGLPSAQDHKRLLEGDRGPNTGGMGAYAPCPLLDSAGVDEVIRTVHQPVVDELARRGTPFRGVLYAGLMMTPDGPRVLEFNVRFGDPECQVLMALWDEDIVPWLHGAASGNLPSGSPRCSEDSAVVVVVASAGYPRTSTKGVAIAGAAPSEGVVVHFAAAQRDDAGVLRTAGGRVLGVTAVGSDLRSAVDRAYAAVPGWRFEGSQVRADIAARAL